ncbi:hypothetical protein BsWGS_20674 [Bradybaena similaris]
MQASASHSNVSLLKTRPIAYKLGLIALVSSFLAFIIGYSTPFWVGFDVGNSETFFSYHAGLWNAPCFYSSTSCHTGILVAQIAFSFHLAGYVICMAVAVYENCKKVNPVSYHSKVLELCVFVTGITGTAGMAVFVVWYSASLSDRSFRWSMNMTSLSLAGIYCTLVLFMIGNRRRFITTRGTVLLQPQQGGIIFFKPGNQGGVSILSNYGPSHPGHQPQQTPQSQPLLPAQPYYCPPGSHYQSPPPPYAYPPAYPLAPAQPPGFTPLTYNERQATGHVQASAPPFDDTQP